VTSPENVSINDESDLLQTALSKLPWSSQLQPNAPHWPRQSR
jgi:hypothetical protein